jgi:non-specific serine/threonine protein kinase/serine/threonine-protein kinase
MNTSVWKRSEELFHRALDCPEDERTQFVDAACQGDLELRAEVLSLLESYCHAAASACAVPPRACEPDAEPLRERRIGAYRIEREIGHGGMGAVFLASRADEQYTKVVAIKLVRTDLATSYFAAHLRAERQILAELEHPNIARLLDGGVTDDGQPFLVMEYVAGDPIDAYCNSRALNVADRLRLFIKICGAVHYAHQRLVIHRDLKPANILVTAEGEPKLLDFGIAKLIEPDSNAGDTTEMMMATPLYCSPELMNGRRATTASDVYSLGVILYCLLTGHSPYSDTAGVELLNAIVTGNIVKPSAAAERANLPGVSPAALKRRLHGDLDNIVLRALRREPEDRYASAELLAEDVRRHLSSLPVMAGSGSVLYDTRKFIRRNRIPVAAGAAVAVSLVAATGFSLHHSRVAARERGVAQQRLESLRKLTGTLLSQLHDSIQSLPGATQARKLMVQSALEYLGSLDTARDRAELAQLVDAYRKIGDVQGNPTNANLGDTAGALASYAKAREIAERLLALDPSHSEARGGYALLLQRAADTIAVTGDVQKAVAASRQSLDVFVALARQDGSPDARQKAGTAHIKLGDLLGHPAFPNLGDRTGALDHYRQSLAIYESVGWDATSRRYLGIIHERIGKMMEIDGRNAEALASYQRSFQIREALAADFPANSNSRRDLAIAHEKIGDLLTSTGRAAEALPRFEEALAIFERMHALDPANANAARAVGIEYEKIAETAMRMGNRDRAREFYAKAGAVHSRLASSDPLNLRAREDRERISTQLAALRR